MAEALEKQENGKNSGHTRIRAGNAKLWENRKERVEFMKKWTCILGAVFCFLLCTVSVQADVIWEPQDSFYEKHAAECDYVNRQYSANGPDGVVILYESPESDKVVATWENGYKVRISHTYEDERRILWGINMGDQTGWMPMEYMKVIYDSTSFWQDYGGQIVSEYGVLEEQFRDEDVYFWRYPGAETFDIVSLKDWEELPQYSSVYADEAGHRWGYIGYYYGYRDVWVCIDAPTADLETLYPDGVPQIEKDDAAEGQENGEQERITPQTNNKTVMIVVSLVVLVVLVTAVLLAVLKKRG